MEKLEILDYQVLLGPQADQEKLVQAWWDLLGHQGFLVLQDFQGKLVFLKDLTVLQENQGSQDHLACLERQDQRAPLEQMLYIAALGVLDQWEKREKWVPREEEEPKEKKEMRDSVPVHLVPWDPLALQDFLGDKEVKET